MASFLAIVLSVLDWLGNSFTPSETKKPPENRGLKDGAGEEGRTPDLMLGKHSKRKFRA